MPPKKQNHDNNNNKQPPKLQKRRPKRPREPQGETPPKAPPRPEVLWVEQPKWSRIFPKVFEVCQLINVCNVTILVNFSNL